MKKTIYSLSVLGLSLMLISCGSLKSSIEKDQQAKNLKVPKGQSLVYIIRNAGLGAAVQHEIKCDDRLVGIIPNKSYLYTILKPGKHRFVWVTTDDVFGKDEEIVIVLEANKVYYMELKIATFKLKMLEDEQGKNELLKCRLSSSNMASIEIE